MRIYRVRIQHHLDGHYAMWLPSMRDAQAYLMDRLRHYRQRGDADLVAVSSIDSIEFDCTKRGVLELLSRYS